MFFDKAKSLIVESFGRAMVKHAKDAAYYDPKTTKDLYDKTQKTPLTSYYTYVMRSGKDPAALTGADWAQKENNYTWPQTEPLTRSESAPDPSPSLTAPRGTFSHFMV